MPDFLLRLIAGQKFVTVKIVYSVPDFLLRFIAAHCGSKVRLGGNRLSTSPFLSQPFQLFNLTVLAFKRGSLCLLANGKYKMGRLK